MRVKRYRIGFLSILLVGLISSVFLNINNIENDNFNYTHDDNREDYFSKIQLSAPSDKNWWDSSYKYRIPINITNNHISNLPKGYSVNISINTTKLISTGKLRSDGKDLRIVWYNSTSTTWLELDRINGTNFDTADTQIWFKTQASINPSADDISYHLYYGNENADDPPTDRSKIYDFYDDFTQSDGPAAGWTVTQGTGWSVINNEYRENEAATDRRTILNTYTVENATIEVRIKHIGGGATFGGGVLFRYSNGNNFYTSGPGFWGDEVATGRWTGGAPLQLDGTATSESILSTDKWYDLRIEMIGNQYDIYLNDSLKNSVTNSDHLNAGQIGFMTWTNNLDVYFDDLKVGLLVATPPILTTGIEEVYGSWYNKDWNYHKKITVTSNSATIPAEYTVSLTFNHESLISAGRSRVDGDDIRVVYWNGSDWRELDRMLDTDSSWNSSSTKIWFRTQAAIAASSFDNNYYLYYGNTLAGSPPTNSDNIFFFYDGFESGNLNGWDANSTGSAGDSIIASTDQANTGNYGAKCDMDDVASPQAMVYEDFPDEESLFARVHIYLDPSFSTSDRVTVMQFIDTSSGWQNLISVTIDDDLTLYMWNAVIGEAYGYGGGGTISLGSWHTLDVQVNVSDNFGVARLWLDGNLDIDNTSIDLGTEPTDRFATGIYWASPNEYNTLYIDDIHLRISVDPEPILTLGKEEISRPSLNYFNYYKEITIDHTKVSGSSNLTDFPVLISILDTDLYDKVQPNGNDVAFYNGTDWLDHEIEVFNQTYSGTQAQLIAWVRIPSLSPTTDTKIYMYYGNSTMSSQENPTGVWDSNYLGVWHLSEDPTGTVYDSTTNNNDGSSSGSMDSGDQILGKIDGSINFDGNDDNIATEENNLLAGRSSFTMSAWIKPLSTQSDFCGIIEYDNTTDGNSFDAAMELRSTRVPRVNIWTTSGFEYVDSSTVLPTTQFTYFVFVYDGDLNIYLDGSFDSSTPHSGNVRNNRRHINIGRNTHDGRSFNGIIDDVHISNIDRSADWITTEYNNQYDPSSFYSIGTEETVGLSIDDFNYYKEITIDHTKVSGSSNLINFPVLISILDTDLHDKVQSNGNDIAFYNGTQWLDHEIEVFNQTYSGTEAQLIAWVRIPSLSPTTDTKIYMYYGNSTMSPQENPVGVWDANYKGIWHLSEDPTGTVFDSTDNNNDGASYGTMNAGDQVTGKIDGSLEFDGTDDYVDCGNKVSLDITGDLTIQYWVKAYDVSNDPDTITKGVYTDAYSSFIYNDRTIYFRLNGLGSTSLQSQTLISLDNWVSVACTRSANTMRIYINGTQDPATATFSEAIEIITDALTIARSPDNLDGIMDEARLSNIARSEDWIATEFNNQYDPNSFYTIGNDTVAPEITIISPSGNELFGSNAPSYNLTVTDSNLDSIWYSLDGGANSTPVSESGTIDQTKWSGRPNGTVTIRFYANDTFGNLNYTEVVVRKDIVDPSIDSIDSPLTGAWFASAPPSYSLSITEANQDEIWYTLDNGINNYTGAVSGTIDSTAWSNAGQGGVTIIFYVNDSAGNWDSMSVDINRDTIDPSIDSIDSPLTGAWYASTPPGYSLTITEANRDDIWYTLDGGLNNYTGALSGTIDSTAWSNAGQGSVTIIFYVNDSAGNWDSLSVDINRDTIDPSIDSIDSPLTGAWFASAPPSYSLSITEANQDEIWYTLDGGVNNYTGAVSGTIDSTAWSIAGQGSVTIIFYVNDSAGNWDSLSVDINRDTIDPSIDYIDSPSSGAWFASAPPSYSLSITEANPDEIWYTLDGGINNYTGAVSGTIDSTAWSNAGQGFVTIIFYVNDSAGNWDSMSVDINRDTIDPSIDSIDSPLTGAWFASAPPSYSLSITEVNRDEIWYTLDGGVNNYTGALSGTIDSTAWSNAGQGSVTILFYVNDSAGNWDSLSVDINRDTIDPIIVSIDSPSSGSNHSTPPSYNLSITEANLDEIWYTLDGGINNYTGAVSGTIDSIAWGNAGLGSVTIIFYINDTVGQWDSASVGVTKTSDLSISINSPDTAEWFNSIPDYDVYVSGNDRDSIWYTIDNGLNNFTITSNADLSNNWFGVIDSIAWGNAGQGPITLTFYLNDTFGITISDTVQINKDTIDPSIDIINSPLSGAWFNSAPPDYSLSITETNLDEIWYTLDGGVNNYTGASSGTIDSTAWSNAGQGGVTILFYVNDSAGNWDSMSVDINRDTIDPSIDSIDSPLTGAWYASTPPGYSLTITEANRDDIWYTLDGGLNNYTGALSGTIDSTAWSNAGQGTVTIIFYVNDSVGNWDFMSVDINRDTIDPSISITAPNNFDLFGSTPPNISINIIDPNLEMSWYQLDNGTVITTNYTWIGFITQGVWDQVGNGTIIIRFYANDTASNMGTAEVTVYKDIYFPIITINSPNSDEVCNSTAPSFTVSVSGSNLDTRWYTLNEGLVNYTFTGLTGTIDQLAWDAPGDGTLTIKFYINNTLGVIGFDEITVIKDTIAPLISINLPSNNTYCGTAPLLNILASDVNLESIWYEVNTIPISLVNNIDQQLDTSIWDSLPEGEFTIYFFANDSVNHLSDPIMITLYKDTVAPSAPLLLNFPQGEVSGDLVFEWQEGSDLSGIVEYRLIIDNEDDPFATPGIVFEIYITGNNYTYTGSLQPGTYYFFLYQIDGASHQSPASTGSFTIKSSSGPSQPSDFPFWIIIVIIGAAIGGLVGVMVLKKSKSKKIDSYKEEAPSIEKKPQIELEIKEELTLLDYETLKAMNREDLIAREKLLIGNINFLEENQKFVKATEFLGEVIIIEELLDNPSAVQKYRQMQIDFAVNGLDYLKDQYEIESKKAAGSGDYSKSLELYKESKVIAENLKIYLEQQKSAIPKQENILESIEKLEPIKDTEIVYSCINDLLTKYFDDIGIKYYYNPQIYDDMNKQIHGLILTDDKFLIHDVDPSIRDKIKAIQILFVEDISNIDIRKLAKIFQSPSMIFIIIGIKWSKDVESQISELNQDKIIKYPENIKLVNCHLFANLIGLKGAYEVALEEIIHLYDHSDIDILQKSHESSAVRMHDTKELIQDLKDKGLIKKKLKEYFHT